MNNCILLQQVQSFSVASPTNGRPLKVLVLEDDADMLRLYQTVLPTWPIRLGGAFVSNGIDAMFKMRRMQPDLLALDLNIPDINDLKVLKETMWQAGLTTLVVSEMDDHRIHNLGCIPSGVDVVPKPVPLAQLMAIAQTLSETKCGATEQVSV